MSLHSYSLKLVALKKLEDLILSPELAGDTLVRHRVLDMLTAVTQSIAESQLVVNNNNGNNNNNDTNKDANKDDDPAREESLVVFQNILNVFLDFWRAQKLNWATRRIFAGNII